MIDKFTGQEKTEKILRSDKTLEIEDRQWKCRSCNKKFGVEDRHAIGINRMNSYGLIIAGQTYFVNFCGIDCLISYARKIREGR